jgi:outer membrane protein OmpA-like peptidoglycan-associated protein
MNHLSERNSKSGTEGDTPGRKKSWASWAVLIAILALAAVGILSFLVLSRLNQIGREVTQLSAQVQQNNQNVAAASEKAESALDRASQAEQSARQAASERDQAEKAKAQFQQQAQQAQQFAAEAQQKAEEYRKEREAELDRLQQALGQIATTRRTALGLVMTLGSKSIRFDFDKSTLRPEDKQVLSRIAGILSTLKGYHIYVYGYTDDIGTREYNLKLSERRAKAVYDYLVQNGLDPSIMSTKGFGEADPLVPGSSPEARAINRRVEIGIVDSTIHPYPALTQ